MTATAPPGPGAMSSRWVLREADPEGAAAIAGALGLDPLVARILITRGVRSVREARGFVAPRLSALPSPFLLKDMERAVARIRRAVDDRETIGIFADSDLDGLTSMTIILRMLKKTGFAKEPYLRYPAGDEDYGLRPEIIREFHGAGVSLLITLDSGIRDVDEIRLAGELGIDVIVCDHHEQGSELPDAIIVNPKQRDCPSPFKELAGVGVAFKLCQAVLMSFVKNRFNRRFVVLTAGENAIHAAFVRNRIVEGSVRLASVEGLSGLRLDPEDQVVLCGIPGNSPVRDALACMDAMEMTDPAIPPGGEASLESLCAAFDVKASDHADAGSLSIELFLEYEYRSAPRLREFIESIVDLVSLGTIADIVPLVGENRTIVRRGLDRLCDSSHPGLRLLVERIGCGTSSKDVSWSIAPLLNTPGRFGQSELMARFFLESSERALNDIMDRLFELNARRRELLSGLYERFHAEVRGGAHAAGKSLIFIADESIPEGLCGLLASRLSDSTGKPVITVALAEGKDVVKGSGRVGGGYNFFSRLEPLSELFERFGGHAQAFGFSARRELLAEIAARIAAGVEDELFDSPAELQIDAEIPLESVRASLCTQLRVLEPFGSRNQEPIFLTRGVAVREFLRFGGDKNHGKYLLRGREPLEAVGWNLANAMQEKAGGEEIDLVYRLDMNEYNGRSTLRMTILDME